MNLLTTRLYDGTYIFTDWVPGMSLVDQARVHRARVWRALDARGLRRLPGAAS